MMNRMFRKLDWKCWVFGAISLLAACGEVQEIQTIDPRSLSYPAPPDEPRYHFERTIYSSAAVTVAEEDSALKSMLTGSAANAEGMSKPYGVTVHQGRIFVSDTITRIVMVFDIAQNKFFKIGEEGAGSLRMPLGIDTDGAGNLYVADATLKSVMVYDRDGKFLRAIGGAKWFARLASVGVDRAGEKVFAVDIGGTVTSDPASHRIRVFDAKSGEHLYDIGKRGTADGEFNLPKDVAVGPDGLLYVVDSGNFRVQVLKQDGTFVRSIGKVGLQLGNFSRPKEIAVDKEGKIYVADSAFGNFQIFNSDGQLLMFIGSRSERDGPAKYSLPAGLAVDEDGRVYMVDQVFRKIDMFRPAELKITEGYAAPFKRPGAAAAGATQVQAQPKAAAPAAKEAPAAGQAE